MKINNCCFNLSEPIIKACWEIKSECNLKCSFCFNDTSNISSKIISISDIHSIIQQLHSRNIDHIIISGGEPLLCDDIFSIIHELESYNILVSICTNATLVDDEFCRKLSETNVKKLTVNIANLINSKDATIVKNDSLYLKVLSGIQKLIEYNFNVTVSDIVLDVNKEQFKNRLLFCQENQIRKISFTVPICKCMAFNRMFWTIEQIQQAISILTCLEKDFPNVEIIFNNPDCLSSTCPSQKYVFGIQGLKFLSSCLVKRDIENFKNKL